LDKKQSFEHHYSVPDPYGHKKWYSESKRIESTLALLFDTGLTFERGLELACGEGDISRELMKVCKKLVAVDISANALKRARELNKEFGERIEFIEADAYELEFPEGSFDFINGMESLHYTKDRSGQVAKWIKWLKPGGYILFSGANIRNLYYSFDELSELFKRPELEILRFEPVNTKFPTQFLQNRSLLPQSEFVWHMGLHVTKLHPRVFAKVMATLVRKRAEGTARLQP